MVGCLCCLEDIGESEPRNERVELSGFVLLVPLEEYRGIQRYTFQSVKLQN